MTKVSRRRLNDQNDSGVVITTVTDPKEIAELDAIMIPFSENGRWFNANYEELKPRYRGLNVVVVNQKIVGYGKDRPRLRRRLQKRGVDLTSSYWRFIPEWDSTIILAKAA